MLVNRKSISIAENRFHRLIRYIPRIYTVCVRDDNRGYTRCCCPRRNNFDVYKRSLVQMACICVYVYTDERALREKKSASGMELRYNNIDIYIRQGSVLEKVRPGNGYHFIIGTGNPHVFLRTTLYFYLLLSVLRLGFRRPLKSLSAVFNRIT